MLIGLGLWFAYDGFVGWPKENARIDQLKADIATARKADQEPEVRRLEAELGKLSHHNDTSITIQKVLAFTLPPIGLFVLVWSFYQSRGAYRLAENTLHVPGHPPVPLDAVTSIDKPDWDRKGIAYVHYELPTGAKGRLCLDDFVYERTPTDAIFEYVQRLAQEPQAPPAS